MTFKELLKILNEFVEDVLDDEIFENSDSDSQYDDATHREVAAHTQNTTKIHTHI